MTDPKFTFPDSADEPDLSAASQPPPANDDRRPMYLGEGVTATIATEVATLPALVTEISCFGMALRPTGEQDADLLLNAGKAVRVALHYRDRALSAFPAVVASISPISLPGEPPIPKISLEFLWDRDSVDLGSNQRTWYTCSDLFPVVAFCGDPFFFQEKIFLRVQRISRRGLWAHASARNKSLIPNITLPLTVQLPSITSTTLPARVVYVEQSSRQNRINLMLQFVDISEENSSLLGEYLLLSGAARSEQLTAEDFQIQRIRSPLDLRYASSGLDFERLLRLRHAFANQTPVPDSLPKEEMDKHLDGFDRCARQLYFVIASEVMAAVRVAFPDGDLTCSELHEISTNFPYWLRNNPFMEASRLVWSLKYKEKDFLLHVLRHLVRIAIETSHNYLVCHIPPALSQVFRSLGFEPLPVEYRPKLPRSSHAQKQEVVVLDVRAAMNRMSSISDRNWEIFYAPLKQG